MPDKKGYSTTKKKIRSKRKKTVTKAKTVSGSKSNLRAKLTKTKTVKRGYRGGGHTRTKVKNISSKRARRVQKRYSK